MFAGRRAPSYALLALVAAVPRLVVVLTERGSILTAYVEKNDTFAQNLVSSGTFGLIPGVPSAYTQPLYGFFLAALYWPFGRHWLVVGLAQVAVAVVTAWLVFEIGRRVARRRTALLAAAIATLEPYLIWHDVHVNREILDAPLAAALVLLTLVAAERGGALLWLALGVVSGVAILGNVRVTAVPLLLAAWIVWRRGRSRELWAGAAVLAVGCGLVLLPWVARNHAEIGCTTVTTDSLALWKANNPATYATLARGGWIDDVVPRLLGPMTPEDAGVVYADTGVVVRIDECALMRTYRADVLRFWIHHPGEKARLVRQAVSMLWSPTVPQTDGRQGAGTIVDTGRSLAEPIYLLPLFALALVGIAVVPRAFAVLALSLLAYQTLAAALFAGTTRYRAPWDFLIVLLAAAGIARVVAALREQGPVERIRRIRRPFGPEGV